MCEYVDTIAYQYTLRLANVAKYMIIFRFSYQNSTAKAALTVNRPIAVLVASAI